MGNKQPKARSFLDLMEAMRSRVEMTGDGDPPEDVDSKIPVGVSYTDESKSPSPVWRKTEAGWQNTGTFKE